MWSVEASSAASKAGNGESGRIHLYTAIHFERLLEGSLIVYFGKTLHGTIDLIHWIGTWKELALRPAQCKIRYD